jgi:hypothetical protein
MTSATQSPAAYTVAGKNAISQHPITARVVPTGLAPKVTSVDIEPDPGYPPTGKVIVHFAAEDLSPDRRGPFRFDVACTAADDQGRELHLMDGDDVLQSYADIEEVYDLRSDGIGADRWKNVTEVKVTVSLSEVS